MPFSAPWMDLEIIILSIYHIESHREWQISHTAYMWNLKIKSTNELIYKTEPQTFKTKLMGGKDKLGVWD